MRLLRNGFRHGRLVSRPYEGLGVDVENEFTAAGGVVDEVYGIDFDNFFNRASFTGEDKIGGEADAGFILRGAAQLAGDFLEEGGAGTEGFEKGFDGLGVLVPGGVGDDAGNITDGAVGARVVDEAFDTVPEREGGLEDIGREMPAVAVAGRDGDDGEVLIGGFAEG